MTERSIVRGVILAAGAGQRIGGPKALLSWAPGISFLDRMASMLREANVEPLVVVGAEHERVCGAHPSLAVVQNEEWQKGQLSSAVKGIGEALARESAAVLVCPVDVPGLASITVRTLREAALAETRAALVPVCRAVRGHPLALGADAARAVISMAGMDSLEEALRRLGVREIPVPDEGVLKGFNSAGEYLEFFGHSVRWVDRTP